MESTSQNGSAGLGIEPAAEFLLDLQWPNLFEPASARPGANEFRCIGCNDEVMRWERERHFKAHKRAQARAEARSDKAREQALRAAGVAPPSDIEQAIIDAARAALGEVRVIEASAYRRLALGRKTVGYISPRRSGALVEWPLGGGLFGKLLVESAEQAAEAAERLKANAS